MYAKLVRETDFYWSALYPWRLWQAPHILPAATLKLSACLCSHNPLWLRGSHFHHKRPRLEEGLPDHTGHLRATKKCWAPVCVSTGVKQIGLYPFFTLDVVFVAFVSLSLYFQYFVVDTGLQKITEGLILCFQLYLFSMLSDSAQSDIQTYLSICSLL